MCIAIYFVIAFLLKVRICNYSEYSEVRVHSCITNCPASSLLMNCRQYHCHYCCHCCHYCYGPCGQCCQYHRPVLTNTYYIIRKIDTENTLSLRKYLKQVQHIINYVYRRRHRNICTVNCLVKRL